MNETDRDEIILPPAEGDAHLTYDELEAYVDGTADAVDREIADEHIAVCELCRAEVADLRLVRESIAPRRPVRWVLAAAAILALVIAALWLLRDRGGAPPEKIPVVETPRRNPPPQPKSPERAPPVQQATALRRPAILDALIEQESVLRGGSDASPFALQRPVGTVVLDPRPRFQWAPVAGATSYDVAVADADSGAVAATGSSRTASWRPGAPLPRGRTYTWQITAHTGDRGDLVAPGPSAPEARFHVAEEMASLPADPFTRGCALAERGVLDEAERALGSAAKSGDARASAALKQVRSWRPQRALPTTTNGAQ